MDAVDTNLPDQIAKATGAGYSATEILDHISDKVGADKVKQAREAGYSDADILKHIGDINTPSSLGKEAALSITTQAPAMLERAAGGTLNMLGIAPELAKSLLGRAKANEAAVNAQDIVDPNAPKGVVDAVTGANGVGDALGRLGSVVGHGLARNIGPVGAGIGAAGAATAAALGGGIPAALGAAGLGATDLALNLGGDLQAKQAAGLNGDVATPGDLLTSGVQTGVNLIPGGKAVSLPARMLLRPVENAGRAAVGSVATDVNTASQGGSVGSPTDVASRALDAATLGAAGTPAFHGATSALGAAGSLATLPSRMRATAKAGPDVRAYAKETSDWDGAVSQEADRLRASNPQMPDDEVQARAEQAATQSGLQAPRFDTLSPQAQNGAAELALLDLYKARRTADTTGMGRKGSQIEPSVTFKNVGDALGQQLDGLTGELLRSGQIDSGQADILRKANSEAGRHNRAAGEGGEAAGGFATYRDQIKGMDLDPSTQNIILQNLRMRDIATENGMKQNAKGFLERHASLLTAGALGAAGLMLHGTVPLAAMGEGGLMGVLLRGQVRSGLRGLDKVLGNQLPPILQREAAIRSFAARNGLQPGTAPGDMMALRQNLQDMAAIRPNPPPVPPGPQPGPVTSGPGADMNAAPPPVPPGLRADPNAAIIRRPAPPPGAPVNAPPAAPVVPPQAPAAAPTPVNTVQAMASLQQALQARNARLAQQAQAAFPSEGRSWSRAIANTLGVPHDAVMAAVKGMDLPAELKASLENQTVSRDVMRAITNRLADMRDRGELPSASPNAPQGGTIRNPLSYAASIRQAEAAANQVRQTRPDLAPVVAAVEAESHVKDKSRVVAEHLAAIKDPAQRAADAVVLTPLTLFGDKRSRPETN